MPSVRDYAHIVVDLVRYHHQWCEYCDGPYDPGVATEDAIRDAIDLVESANGLQLPTTDDELQDLAGSIGLSCPNCNTGLGSGIQVGTRWAERELGAGHKLQMLTRGGWDYLTHFTKPTDSASAFDVIRKILDERQLCASSHMIRGKHEVVCFTEASPPEIEELPRVDAEGGNDKPLKWSRSKHGVAVRRRTLIKEAGARPAIHADSTLYASLPARQQHLFVRFEHDRSLADWTFEREFRVLGDLDLRVLGPMDLIVIVESYYERSLLLAQARPPPWPIVVFSELHAKLDHFVALSERQHVEAKRSGMDVASLA